MIVRACETVDHELWNDLLMGTSAVCPQLHRAIRGAHESTSPAERREWLAVAVMICDDDIRNRRRDPLIRWMDWVRKSAHKLNRS